MKKLEAKLTKDGLSKDSTFFFESYREGNFDYYHLNGDIKHYVTVKSAPFMSATMRLESLLNLSEYGSVNYQQYNVKKDEVIYELDIEGQLV
jgi:hypothetical protein